MQSDTDLSPWYKQFWPWLLIGLPATTVVAGIAMIFIAGAQPVALVKDDYYEEGKAINRQLDRDKMAAALGRTAVISFGADTIDIKLAQLAGEEQVTVQFIHPLDDRKDQRFEAMRIGPNHFQVIGTVTPQRWYIELEGGHQQQAWRLNGEAALRTLDVVVITPPEASE